MIQLGTRWRFGEQPPARLDLGFADMIREAESTLIHGRVDGDARDGYWTLTWLEGRPTALFDLETVAAETVSVTVDASEQPSVIVHRPADDDEEW